MYPWTFELANPMKKNSTFSFQIFKGTHINTVLSANDANFITDHPIAKSYYEWVKDMTVSAEEHHAATLLRFRLKSSNVG